MKFSALASGSKGNCTLVSNGNTNILIDFGISYREFLSRIESIGFQGDITAILITHTHSDHIKGLGQLLKNHDIAIYAHKKMQDEIRKKVGISDMYINIFDGVFAVGDIDILPFATPHDTAVSYGYTLAYMGKRISIATDLGYMPEKVFRSIKDSDLVLLEANYDEDMLIDGNYPYFLKQRILSQKGHLSNIDCAVACGELVRHNVKHIVLGHMSENNNDPDIALMEVREYLTKQSLDGRANLYLALQGEALNIIEL